MGLAVGSPYKGGLRGVHPHVHFAVNDSKYLIFLSKISAIQIWDMSDIFSHFYIKNPIFIISVREAHNLYHEMYPSDNHFLHMIYIRIYSLYIIICYMLLIYGTWYIHFIEQ